MPKQHLDPLLAQSRQIFEKSLKLRGAVHASTRHTIRELVRSMNAYYSNLIEGQSTHPRNIEQALQARFSGEPDIAQRQRIALAHIEAEKELEELAFTEQAKEADVLRSGFLVEAHRRLYRRLAASDRTTDDGRVIVPGELRQEDVAVGRHQAPTHTALPAFLARMDEVYPKLTGLDPLLYGIASAHHRAAWVHPFGDGNGRACRLQSHCALSLISGGLWSVSRGLARQRQRYYETLSNADMSRQGDLDGRGNLSEKMLREWCMFFLEVCHDQVDFMTRMLDLDGVRERLAALVLVRSESALYPHYSRELILPLHHVFVAGPISRGDFIRLTGMSERSARRGLSQLMKDGLLVSGSPKGPVSFGLPLDSLHILLPNLYPEASSAHTGN